MQKLACEMLVKLIPVADQMKLFFFAKKSFIESATGADAIKISGLLNPKKLGTFKN